MIIKIFSSSENDSNTTRYGERERWKKGTKTVKKQVARMSIGRCWGFMLGWRKREKKKIGSASVGKQNKSRQKPQMLYDS